MQRRIELFRNELSIEALLERVSRHTPEAFSEDLTGHLTAGARGFACHR
jgi:hypothetical protein